MSRIAAIAAIAAVAAPLSACSDMGGYMVMGVNASTEDVIVEMTSGRHESYRLPAGHDGRLFISNSDPAGQFNVYDAHCELRAQLPFEASGITVWVDESGAPSLHPSSDLIPDGVVPVDNDPKTGGPAWDTVVCP